ncbi:MAG: hypothetical protein AABX54_03350 [Nanoarchaeota archaeon]
MAETTKTYKTKCATDGKPISYKRWPVSNVIKDLVRQGGLERDCLELENDGFDSYLAVHKGNYKGNRFEMRWEHEIFLLIAMKRDEPELVQAFAKVLGQKPFARYVFEGYEKPVTYEWEYAYTDEEGKVDKGKADKRFKELKEDERKKELVRMDEE